MSAVEGGRGAAGEGGERVGGCEEEGRAEAVVGVEVGHFFFWVFGCELGWLVGCGDFGSCKGLVG